MWSYVEQQGLILHRPWWLFAAITAPPRSLSIKHDLVIHKALLVPPCHLPNCFIHFILRRHRFQTSSATVSLHHGDAWLWEKTFTKLWCKFCPNKFWWDQNCLKKMQYCLPLISLELPNHWEVKVRAAHQVTVRNCGGDLFLIKHCWHLEI